MSSSEKGAHRDNQRGKEASETKEKGKEEAANTADRRLYAQEMGSRVVFLSRDEGPSAGRTLTTEEWKEQGSLCQRRKKEFREEKTQQVWRV
jgi:hypothetical protein